MNDQKKKSIDEPTKRFKESHDFFFADVVKNYTDSHYGIFTGAKPIQWPTGKTSGDISTGRAALILPQWIWTRGIPLVRKTISVSGKRDPTLQDHGENNTRVHAYMV